MNALAMKDIISIKIKPRQDSVSDQFNRIFMVKIYILSSLVICIDYFRDTVSCIVPPAQMDPNFIHSACWISGFYVFADLTSKPRKVGYYGIPKDLNHDGIDNNDELCSVHDRFGERSRYCQPMEKTYYLQYQWYPFFMGGLALLHYFPYILFRLANSDVVNLKRSIKDHATAETIIKTFFNASINPPMTMAFRTTSNVIVKMLYPLVNALAFYFIDSSLNKNFLLYGIDWLQWSKRNSSMAHNQRDRPIAKASHRLLPTMGICEIHEATHDQRNTMVNRHRFVCEISPNVLYQHVLLVLWWLMVATTTISSLGLLHHVSGYLKSAISVYCKGTQVSALRKCLNLRERTYLDYVRGKDLPLYADILKKLQARQKKEFEMMVCPLRAGLTKSDENARQSIALHGQNPHNSSIV